MIRNLTGLANSRDFLLIFNHAQIFNKARHGNQLVGREDTFQHFEVGIGNFIVKTNFLQLVVCNNLDNLPNRVTRFDNIKILDNSLGNQRIARIRQENPTILADENRRFCPAEASQIVNIFQIGY